MHVRKPDILETLTDRLESTFDWIYTPYQITCYVIRSFVRFHLMASGHIHDRVINCRIIGCGSAQILF